MGLYVYLEAPSNRQWLQPVYYLSVSLLLVLVVIITTMCPYLLQVCISSISLSTKFALII